MRILLIGKNGQFGWELQRQLEQRYRVFALGREDIDLQSSAIDLKKALRHPQYDLIINAAAYTKVDMAEKEKELAFKINAEVPHTLAAEAARRGIPIIHFSTDYVFDGKKPYPYREDHAAMPLNVYGASKYAGEQNIQQTAEKHYILRLSCLFGLRGNNFFQTVIRKHSANETFNVVQDQYTMPTWTVLAGEAVMNVVNRLESDNWAQWGVYHLAGKGAIDWYSFAQTVYTYLNKRHNTDRKVIPTITEKYDTTAQRPMAPTLDSTKFNKAFNYTLPHWSEQLELLWKTWEDSNE